MRETRASDRGGVLVGLFRVMDGTEQLLQAVVCLDIEALETAPSV